jgi:2'-5' RNA ligase
VAETAIVVLVPELEPLVGELRRRHTVEGAHGMGAHVTLLYPFYDTAQLDAGRIAEVADALGPFEAFDFSLAATMRFPENQRVLCLRPEPDEPFRAMTHALAAAFPEHPPYGGKYREVIPHLTIALGDDELLDGIERDVAGSLPIEARAVEATLFELDATGTWRPHARLPFL